MDKGRNRPSGNINLKHYFGKLAKSSGVWFMALAGTTIGVGTLVDEVMDEAPDRNGTSYQAVENFENRMTDLIAQRDALENANTDAISNELQQNYTNDVYSYLADVMVDTDGSSLSEYDKAALLNAFDRDVEDLEKYGFYPLDEDQAGHLNNFKGDLDNYNTDNLVSKVDLAQDMNTNALAEGFSDVSWQFWMMMIWAIVLFPGRREWKENKTLNRMANEPPRKPKQPKFKH